MGKSKFSTDFDLIINMEPLQRRDEKKWIRKVLAITMSEVEEYMEDALDKLLEKETCEDSLNKLDSLLGQLCILSNQINLQSNSNTLNNTKSFLSKTQKPILKVWKVPTVDDLIFGQFIELQSKFQYNITSHIIQLLSKDILTDECLILANQVLQGCLLLHPPSRDLFKRKSNMTLLLRYLNKFDLYSPKLITTIIQSFVCIMVRNVPNLRNFEVLNGPQLICQIFNTTTEKAVKYKSLEFLMFYLIPESTTATENLFPSTSSSHLITSTATTTATFHTNSSTSSVASSATTPSLRSEASTAQSSPPVSIDAKGKSYSYQRKTMDQKLSILKPYLDNVDELINQFMEIKPFGKMRNIDW